LLLNLARTNRIEESKLQNSYSTDEMLVGSKN